MTSVRCLSPHGVRVHFYVVHDVGVGVEKSPEFEPESEESMKITTYKKKKGRFLQEVKKFTEPGPV